MGSWVDMGFALVGVEGYNSCSPVYRGVVLLEPRKAKDDIVSDRGYIKGDMFMVILKL